MEITQMPLQELLDDRNAALDAISTLLESDKDVQGILTLNYASITIIDKEIARRCRIVIGDVIGAGK